MLIIVDLSDRGRWWPHGRSSNLVEQNAATAQSALRWGQAGEAQNTTKSDAGGEAREGGFLSLSWQYTAKVCKALVNVHMIMWRTKLLTVLLTTRRLLVKDMAWVVPYRLWRFSHKFEYFSLPLILSVTQMFDQGLCTAYSSRFKT